MRESRKSILLTFDVEDWFQVENFKQYIKFSTWNSFQLRVERNTHTLLNLLDAFTFKTKATFFILGWIAQKLPDLVREIDNRGHEVASHGYDHHLCSNLDSKTLTQDLEKSKKLLEDLTGHPIKGYRAPSFAVNNKILEAIKLSGYKYDSSYNSFSGHGRYGTIDLSDTAKNKSAYKFSNNFYEIPISNLSLFNKIFPLGGGGYFRLYPLALFKQGMKQVLKHNDAFIFYAHPWEFDPEQPRVHEASQWFKFRHYINLHKTEDKLNSLIKSFSYCRFTTCTEYLDHITET